MSISPFARRLLALLAVGGVLVLPGAWGARRLVAWHHLREARRLLDARGPTEAARAHLDACLAAWPSCDTAQLLAARAARLAGDQEAAEGHLDAYGRLAGVTEAGTLEHTLLRVQRQGLTPEAEAYLRARIGEEDEPALAILDALTSEYMRTYRLLDARRLLDDWLRRRPPTADALVRRGWVAERMAQPTPALADYERALTIDPERDAVRLRVAELHLQNKQPAQALPHLERLLTTRPDDRAVRLTLARCRADLGQTEEARTILDQWREEELDAAGLCLRGRLLLAEGDAAAAGPWLRRAVERAPHDREAIYNLQLCLTQQGEPEEAARMKARLDALAADQKRMATLMSQLLERPRDPALRYEIGTIFLRNGFPEDGVRWLYTTLEVAPQHAEAHAALADHYEKLGDRDRAAPHRRLALPPARP